MTALQILAGLSQAEFVLRKSGQWQAADACAEARVQLAASVAVAA